MKYVKSTYADRKRAQALEAKAFGLPAPGVGVSTPEGPGWSRRLRELQRQASTGDSVYGLDSAYAGNVRLTAGEQAELAALFAAATVIPDADIDATPTDVPYHWTQVTAGAAFAGRDGAGGAVLGDYAYLIGGWNPADPVHFPNTCNSEVWCAPLSDMATWTQLTDFPAEGRHTFPCVVYRDRIHVLGGDDVQGHYQGEHLAFDGSTWEVLHESAPWMPRTLSYAAVYDDAIWLFGGQARLGNSGVHHDDVWRYTPENGWERVIESGAPYAPRGLICGDAADASGIWLPCGGLYSDAFSPFVSLGDVWHFDGSAFRCTQPSAVLAPRIYHSVACWDGLVWVMSGEMVTATESTGNRNDVLYSADGFDWTALPASSPMWAGRHAATVWVTESALYLGCGNNSSGPHRNDIWKLERV